MSGRRRILWIAIVALAAQGLAVIVYLGVERRRPARGDAPFRFERLQKGRTAPDLLLARADGSTRRLSDLRGKSVLLHFWATWCPPCREELPGLLALGRERARARTLEVVAVALDEDWSTIGEFFGGDIPGEVAQDRSRRSAGLYDLSALPETYLVGPDGVLRLRVGGARNWRGEAARDLLRRHAGLDARE